MPSIVGFDGAEKATPPGRPRLSPKETIRLRIALMFTMERRGWSLRQLGALFGASPTTVMRDIKCLPPSAAARLERLSVGLLGGVPTPDQMEKLIRDESDADSGEVPKPDRRRSDPPLPPLRTATVIAPHRANPSPEARRLAAQAVIDARCLEALGRCGGDARKAAKALRIAPARILAAMDRRASQGGRAPDRTGLESRRISASGSVR